MRTPKPFLLLSLVTACALAGCHREPPAPAPATQSVAPAPADTAPPVEPDVVRGETTHEPTETEAPELPPGTEAAPDPEPDPKP
ncbi:MAG: hypothetical protein KA391_05340 [Luteimonas sp.]|nr:hypothetical protein [Luteimonas sp.]